MSARKTLDFIFGWSGGAPVVLTAIHPDRRNLVFFLCSPANAKKAEAWLVEKNKTRNIYFSVNGPRSPKAKKYVKNEIEIFYGLHVDCDVKLQADTPEYKEAMAASLKGLKEYSPKPTAIIFSGGGYQGFWKFHKPEECSIEDVESRNRRLEQDLGGDHCHNADRIMRAPYTINHPDKIKRERGRGPVLSEIVFESEDTYSINDFRPVEETIVPPGGAATKRERKALPKWAAHVIADGPDKEGKYSWEGDRSKAVWAACCEMVRCGWSDEDIAATILDPKNKISEHVLVQGDPAKYARRQAAKARQEVGSAVPWRERSRDGTPTASMYNAQVAILSLGVECRHNTFHNKILMGFRGDETQHELQTLAGEMSDNGTLALRDIISKSFGFDPTSNHTHDAIVTLALKNCFDPVCDELDKAQAEWDGIERVDRFAVDYLNCDDTKYNKEVGRVLLLSAVARARHPGCQHDLIPVLESPEGWNKSGALRVLAGEENFSDVSILGKDGREVQEQLADVWIHENADLDGLKKADVDKVKAFASRREDRARPAYGRANVRQHRHSIEVGTTNSSEYLQSQTGNRRFAPIRVLKQIDIEKLKRDRLQIWGEAATRESEGESHKLREEVWADAGREQEARRSKDPWEDILDNIPAYVDGQGNPVDAEIVEFGNVQIIYHEDGYEKVLSADLLTHVLRIPIDRQERRHSMRLADVMRQLGWERPEGGKKLTVGGRQVRGYQRKKGAPEADLGTQRTPKGVVDHDIPF